MEQIFFPNLIREKIQILKSNENKQTQDGTNQ